MAIPTQFSVANKAKRPIANPDVAQDLANVISAEAIGFISGASSLPSKATSETGSAVIIDSEAAPGQDSAVIIGAQSTPSQGEASALPVIAQPDIDNASAATTQNAPAFSAPSVIAPKSGTAIAPPFPLNHARILYNNLLVNTSLSTDAAGSTPSNSRIPNTWQRWQFTANTKYIDFQFGSLTNIDTICIGAHNISDSGSLYRILYSPNTTGSFIQLVEKTPSTNAAIMYHRDSLLAVRRIRVQISGADAFKDIGYISAGIALQMQRPFFNGHQPYTDSDVTEYYSNRTESGEIIGRQIRRRGFETSYEWSNLDDEWYRVYIPAFKQAAKISPFFIAWNLLEYPDDVAFGETTGDISTSMQNGTRVKRSGLSFTLKGV